MPKCPYLSESTVAQVIHEYIYDDEGRLIKDIMNTVEKYKTSECLKENCAAYIDGKCVRIDN